MLVLLKDQNCPTLETCELNLSGEDVYDILMNNFKMHYTSNRAPLGLHFTTAWIQNPDYYTALSVSLTGAEYIITFVNKLK